jgi:hypothetical protein
MKRLVLLLAAVAAAVALAGAYLPSSAATVGQTSISRQALDSDLSAIAGSADYVCFLSEERQLSTNSKLPVLGAGTASAKGGIYDAAFVDNWLASMVTDTVISALITRDGLRVTPSDLATARGVLSRRITDVLDTYARDSGLPSPSCSGSGQAVLSSLPPWFRSEQVRAEAAQALLDARAAGSGLSAGAIATYFARHRVLFDKDCVDVVVVQTPSAAAQVEAALARGVSFAHEAQVASLTRTSAANGGVAGCGYLQGTFLGTAVGKLAVGAVTPVVPGAGVYWVVKLASRSAVSLRTARLTVVTAILRAGQGRADAVLVAALRSTSVGVDPRYGGASAHSLALVLPAPSPPPGAELSPSANRPTLTAASS